MSIINNFGAIKAELDKIEKKVDPTKPRKGLKIHGLSTSTADPGHTYSGGTDLGWMTFPDGTLIRNIDTGEVVQSSPNSIYSMAIWEVAGDASVKVDF